MGVMCTKNPTETDGTAEVVSSSPLDPLEVYNMNKTRRGLALIFNQQSFVESKLCYRCGSDIDCSNLKKSLKHLGFEVKAFTDLSESKVHAKLDKAATADHSNADCFLVVFMSHGEKNYVNAFDKTITIQEIVDKFRGTNCKSLVGKPKIFIWQACRGDKHDDPVTPCATEPTEVVEAGAVYTLPAAADFIMCYSVAEGYYSYRDPLRGSWYIQDLCELLQTYGDSLEFTHLLTLVNAKVSKRDTKMDKNGKNFEAKQVPCFASMLTKKLYFHPKQFCCQFFQLSVGERPHRQTTSHTHHLQLSVRIPQNLHISNTADMSEESFTETDGLFTRKLITTNQQVTKDSPDVYNMTKVRSGRALIFNWMQFDLALQLNPRFGSDKDYKNLKKRREDFGFEVNIFKDLKKSDVNAKLDEAAKADYSNVDCLLVVYMSHGEKDYVETYDEKLMISDITDKFRGDECKSLAGKPKIFIWQACRGSEFDEPVDSETEHLVLEAGSINVFPAGADFIMCYAVAEGYYAHRDSKNGSWYIQDLCKQLKNCGDSLEFTELLTLVNNNVSKMEDREKKKQIPCFASMLTKNLYLQKKFQNSCTVICSNLFSCVHGFSPFLKNWERLQQDLRPESDCLKCH
ncbi:caspase-4-like [Betta splendens]|uniref:Caspase-6 n=1 Tax=Betta splendens TaxID=158456 RepID=A0A9W2XR72_BETSP|nr:caspase-4-like [Betta splendens]